MTTREKVNNLLHKAKLEIVEGEFSEAAATCDQVGELCINSATLWMYRLLIEHRVCSLGQLATLGVDFGHSRNYSRAVRLANPDQKSKLEATLATARKNLAKAQAQAEREQAERQKQARQAHQQRLLDQQALRQSFDQEMREPFGRYYQQIDSSNCDRYFFVGRALVNGEVLPLPNDPSDVEYIQADPQRGYQAYVLGAEGGSAKCAFGQALCLQHGIGVAASAKHAAELFASSSAQLRAESDSGDVVSQWMVGSTHRYGDRGVMLDCARAAELFASACCMVDGVPSVAGFVGAGLSLAHMLFYGQGIPKNVVLAAKYYSALAQRNHREALYALGLCWAQGLGVHKNAKRAAECLQRASDLGSDLASLELATMTAEGRGVKRNLAQAMRLLRLAAQRGNVKACLQLGENYQQGNWVDVNLVEAVYWFEQGAKADNPDAISQLAFMTQNGLGIEPDQQVAHQLYANALALYQAMGTVESFVALSSFFELGRGTEVDFDEAIRWMLLAQSNGWPGATEKLNYLRNAQALAKIAAKKSAKQ